MPAERHRVLITGSRTWADTSVICDALAAVWGPSVVQSGDGRRRCGYLPGVHSQPLPRRHPLRYRGDPRRHLHRRLPGRLTTGPHRHG